MRKRRSTPLFVAILISAVGVMACTREEPSVVSEETQVTAPETERSDAELTTAVQGRFYADPQVRGGRIDVAANNGVVTLSGTANSDAARQRAIQVAQEVEGVTRVEDRLMVETAEPTTGTTARGTGDTEREETVEDLSNTPGWITTKIQAQYFVSPAIKPWNVDVTTSSGGVVTLEGNVEDAEAKTEAVRIARATEGVTRVEDHLRVGPEETAATTGADTDLDRPDVWLTTKIRSKYFIDGDVRARNIDVTTQNGVVTLEGTVASAEEQRQAVALARNTDGVRDVRDQLKVDPAADAGDGDASDRARGTAGTVAQRVDDAWITTKVQSQYFLDADVKGHRIDVDTRNGVVTLSGTVASNANKQEAETIARETEGVSRVVNRLTVGAGEPQPQPQQQQP